MIEFENLTIETRHTIFDQVNYKFNNSSIYGIVAINGAGKTTLFRTMMNLYKAKAGSILIDHESVEAKLKDIFYYESVEWLDKNLTGRDYLTFVKQQWMSALSVDEIIHLWSMEEFIALPIRKYSLGMKQRLVIGMYMISDVTYMIMDEITSGLDEENRALFFNELQKLKQRGKTILLSSHYKDEIIEICDIVLEIKHHSLEEVSI